MISRMLHYFLIVLLCGGANISDSSAVDKQKKVSLHFQEAPVDAVLQALADYQKLNLVMDDSLTGHLTLQLEDVPWQQAMDVVARVKQLKVDIEGNILLISPQPSAEELRQASVDQEKLKEDQAVLHTIRLRLKHTEAAILADLLTSLLSSRGSIIADERSNTLLVRDTEAALLNIEEAWFELDQPQPQVQIAAHIVTISSDSLRELGVSWGLGAKEGGASALRFKQFNVDLPVANPALGVGFHLARLGGRLLELELSALEQENQVEIIASPRLLTLNKQKASIKQGTEIPYEVSSGASGATSVEFKEAVLGMEVTPRIMPNGQIELALLISQNMPGRMVKSGTGEALAIDKQEISTQVIISNGETLALGGIFQQTRRQGVDKVPGLGNIPLLGNLFQRESKQHSRRELVIFITPTLVEKQAEP